MSTCMPYARLEMHLSMLRSTQRNALAFGELSLWHAHLELLYADRRPDLAHALGQELVQIVDRNGRPNVAYSLTICKLARHGQVQVKWSGPVMCAARNYGLANTPAT